MTQKKFPADILYADITPEFWKNDAAGPIVVGNKLRSYLGRAKFLGKEKEARQAEAQLAKLRELVPDIDGQFRRYDEERSRIRRER